MFITYVQFNLSFREIAWKQNRKKREIKIKTWRLKLKLEKSLLLYEWLGKRDLNVSSEDTPYNGESYSLHRFACAHDYTGAQSTRSRLTAAARRERASVNYMFAVSTRITRYNRNYELASTATRVRVRASARGRPSECTCGGQEWGCPVKYIRTAYASVVLRPTCRSCRIRSPTTRITLTGECLCWTRENRSKRVGKTRMNMHPGWES